MEEATLLLPIFSQDNSDREIALLPHMIMTLASIQVNVILQERRIYEFCGYRIFLFVMYYVGVKYVDNLHIYK